MAATEAEELVELGSGSASKSRVLLDAMAERGTLRRYVPVDVSESVIERSALELVSSYSGLEVHGVIADFERHLENIPPGRRRLVAFLGGTIGNLYPEERLSFLTRLRNLLGRRDRLVLGTDLVKDREVLEAAYNDAAGVTAEFNRNVLRVINRRLGADFNPGAFDHVAFFDPQSSWVEMRLQARGDQRVEVKDAAIEAAFADGEEMRTEISAKFTHDGLQDELHSAGLRLERFITDPARLFALSLVSAR